MSDYYDSEGDYQYTGSESGYEPETAFDEESYDSSTETSPTAHHAGDSNGEETEGAEAAAPRALNDAGEHDAITTEPSTDATSIVLNKIPRFATLTVGDPQKVSDGSSSYVSYLVTSQQYADERADRVRRRFSEFADLYRRLEQEFPPCAVPPLPDRWRLEYIAGDRFSTEFTTKRAASLQRFLFRISQHPQMRRSKHFKQFLSGGVGAGKPSVGTGASAGAGAPAAGLNSNSNGLAAAAIDQLSDALMNAFQKAQHQSKDMIDARERADRFEQNLYTIDKAVVRTSKAQTELAGDFEAVHRHALRLANSDATNAQEFEVLAAACNTLSSSARDLRLGVDSRFACAVRDMSHYVQALKGMLKRREQRQIEYEALVEYLKRAEAELVAIEHGQPPPTFSTYFLKSKVNELRGIDKERMRQQRVQKLSTKIAELKDVSSKVKTSSDAFEELAKREVRDFDQTEAIELQQSLTGLSDSYIQYYSNILESFSGLRDKLY